MLSVVCGPGYHIRLSGEAFGARFRAINNVFGLLVDVCIGNDDAISPRSRRNQTRPVVLTRHGAGLTQKRPAHAELQTEPAHLLTKWLTLATSILSPCETYGQLSFSRYSKKLIVIVVCYIRQKGLLLYCRH